MNKIVIVMLAGLMAACAAMPGPGASGTSTDPYTVDIYWSTTDSCKVDKVVESATTCIGVTSDICVGRGDFIEWRSNDPSNAKYEIFFDPIQNAPLKAGGNGRIKKPMDANAPIATYKYSIVRDGCSPTLDNTYDPHIRVDH